MKHKRQKKPESVNLPEPEKEKLRTFGEDIPNYGNNKINLDALATVIRRRITRGELKEADVIMLGKGELLKVLRHKNKAFTTPINMGGEQ